MNTIIKPYSPLIFEVELLSFEKGAAPDHPKTGSFVKPEMNPNGQ